MNNEKPVFSDKHIDEIKRKDSYQECIFDSDYILNKEIVHFLEKHSINCNQSILDYGAGNIPYKNLFNSERYFAVDIQQNKNNSIDLIIKPNEDIPISDKFDLILLMDVLEHISEPEKVLNNLNEKLHGGGKLLVSIPYMYRQHEMPYDFYRYTESGIKYLLQKSGFFDIKIKKIGNQYFTLYSLWNESIIKNGEILRPSLFRKIFRKIFRTIFIPIFNKTIFLTKPNSDDSIYHHLLIECTKYE